MVRLKEYINEALRAEVTKWLEQVYNNMKGLIKDNKLEPLEVDEKKLSKPDKGGFMYDDFATDKLVKEIVEDKQLGFTVTTQLFQNPKKYLIANVNDVDKELKPECLPYWYQGENIFFVGLILLDTTTSYIDDFVNIVNIETALYVKNSEPILTAMLNDFALHYINKKGNYKGLCAKPSHPKIKATLLKLGFKTFEDNKDILTYKL